MGQNQSELLVSMLLDYLYHEYNRLQNDLAMVKERIRIFGFDADRAYELLVCETRLDLMATESRKLRQLIQLYGDLP